MTPFDRIREGVWRARGAFAAGSPQPIEIAAIELLTPEDGVRLMSIIDPMANVENWLRDDGSPGLQIDVDGVIVRWPARWLALPNGGWKDVP